MAWLQVASRSTGQGPIPEFAPAARAAVAGHPMADPGLHRHFLAQTPAGRQSNPFAVRLRSSINSLFKTVDSSMAATS
jgi:hypothetical protein